MRLSLYKTTCPCDRFPGRPQVVPSAASEWGAFSAYVGNPRSKEKNPESRFCLAHFMNPCTRIQRNPRGLPVALAKCILGLTRIDIHECVLCTVSMTLYCACVYAYQQYQRPPPPPTPLYLHHQLQALPVRLLSKDQQVTRTRQQNKPLTRTQSKQRRNDTFSGEPDSCHPVDHILFSLVFLVFVFVSWHTHTPQAERITEQVQRRSAAWPQDQRLHRGRRTRPPPVSRASCFIYKLVNKRSDTDLGNTQSAPRGGERATVCCTITAVGGGVREAFLFFGLQTQSYAHDLAHRPIGLNKILFYIEECVHESIILSWPPPTCIAHTIAILLGLNPIRVNPTRPG